VRSIPVILFNAAAQKYIGDKVRQAERLLAWSKSCELEINSYLDSIFPSLVFGKHSERVSPQIIGDRLDAEYYKKEQLGLEEYFVSGDQEVKSLLQLSANSFSGPAIPGQLFGTQGIPVLQTKDINEKGIDLDGCVKISQADSSQYSRFSATYGSLIMGMSGTVGRTSLLYKEGEKFIINQRVSAIEIKDKNLMGFVCFYLNHRFGKMQMARRSVGGVQANISLSDILSVKVIQPENNILSNLNAKALNVFLAIDESKKLTNAAKFLVEALIEGHVTEAELIAAEQALQTGNDQPDRRILNRLKADGIDGKGQALFSDLDQLYSLVEQASHS
jgi:type I restriction enzyme S subunit